MGGKDNPPPDEYLEFLVMDRLKKFKSEVEREAARDIYQALVIMTVESEVARARQKGSV